MGQAKLTSITDNKAAKFDRTASERDTIWCDQLTGLHLIKLKKGCTWRYRYRDATGKRRTATIAKLAEKKPHDAARIVLDWLDEEADPLAERKEARQQALTAAEEAERRTMIHYLEGSYRDRMKKWGEANARNTEQRLKNHFGLFLERDLATLTRNDVWQWQERTAGKGRAHSTIQRTYGALKTMLNKAVEDGILDANPLDGVSLKEPEEADTKRERRTEEERKNERRMLTDDELSRVASGLDAFGAEIREERRNSRAHGKSYLPDLDAVNHPHWFIPMAYLAMGTGLRPGDLRTVRWGELSLRFGEPCLEKETEKSQAARRRGKRPAVVNIPLSEQLTRIMREWWEDQGKPDSGLVFPSPRTGRELDRQATRKPWKRVKELGGLPAGLDFYCFRHHFISALLAQRTPIFEVARLAGHKSVSMIEGHYGHQCPDQRQRVVDIVGATINRAANGEAV